MNSVTSSVDAIRGHARTMLTTIGVSRIIVVDDEYAVELPGVEELLGICTELQPAQAAELPSIRGIDFMVGRDIWADLVRQRWTEIGDMERRMLLEKARSYFTAESASAFSDQSTEILKDDSTAAQSLEELLGELEGCQFVTLSLNDWRTQARALQCDEKAATTLLLFDRDFRREEEGTDNEGLKLIEEMQSTNIGYYGLISHTVNKGGEYDAWNKLANEHGLVRDRFIVIAKERLTGDLSEHYGFLRMLRLAALSGRFSDVKSAALCIFQKSLDAARTTVQDLSVLDFDRIVFESSRREGVWEPDTLFRVFGILMRREALAQLYRDERIFKAFAEARRVSAVGQEIGTTRGNESPSLEGLRIQRFETYGSANEINQFHVPIENGDIFEKVSDGRRFILLLQPCDLMVRSNGKRSYDGKLGRTGSLAELEVHRDRDMAKGRWGELPFYDQNTGKPAFADFNKVHQVLLAVLDLCSFQPDGVASIDVNRGNLELLVEPWNRRYVLLRRFFEAALTRYEKLKKKQINKELLSLVLPVASPSVRFEGTVSGKSLCYDLKRVMRLRQPRSGALLTWLTQFQARAAFEHDLDEFLALQMKGDDHQESQGR